jgi:hypothetical protein
MVECRFDVAGVGINLPTFGATLLRALRDWGVSMANESSVVSFPAGKPAQASAKNRVSNSPNYHLEQLIALRDEYQRKAEIIDYAIELLRSRL